MNSKLRLMLDCLFEGDPIFHPSKFWEALNKKNIEQLEKDGIENFKQTIALNYFTWTIGYRDEQFRYLLMHTNFFSWPVILNGLFTQNHSSHLTRRQQMELVIFEC